MKKRGQVWVETVIYTLIAFVMIGMVLAYAKPKIEEFQDKAVIEQSIEILKDIDGIIKDIQIRGSGNQRLVELGIKKGSFEINGINNTLKFEIESRCEYSEPGENYLEGEINVLTEKKGKLNLVTLTKNYGSEYNITHQQKDEIKSISKAATSYSLVISNNGKSANKTIINIEVN